MQECEIQEGVPLAPSTTTGLGGSARYWAVAGTVDHLRYCLAWAGRKGFQVQVLGGGSNILFPDAGYDGLVVKVGLQGVTYSEREDRVLVRAGAGEEWDQLVSACVGRGLAGIECLSGIPGLVGATPIQNVGAYGQQIKESVQAVLALDRQTQDEVEFSREECGFGYRQSRFKGVDRDRFIVTAVSYLLEPEGRPQLTYKELDDHLQEGGGIGRPGKGRQALEAVRQGVLELRRAKSMVVDADDPNSRSVGSFFLNPVLDSPAYAELVRRWEQSGGREPVRCFRIPEGYKVPAAWLVERAGYAKGFEQDGAGISVNHALALVNRGGTTAAILRLADDIAAAVAKRFAVRLEREPVVIMSDPSGRRRAQ
jgi:UDP-N-acetylmuramate dehydrogenase